MKKTTIIISLAAITSLSLLQSCNGKSQANTQMQKPATESTSNEKEDAEGKSDKLTSLKANATNIQNMQAAFKGETTASAKYAAYSKKAEAEGQHQIALLFLAASKSEKIHANNHKAVIEDAGQKTPAITPEFTVKTTAENLKDAIAGESYEISTMYPEFLKNANTAGNQLSLMSLNYAYKTEQKHKPLYEKALAALQNNTVKSLPTVYYICPTCGNTYDTNAPKRCGISMTSSEKFIKIANLES
ncbi:rubrerythrin family protein [Flavobacterium sp. UBA6031]|uniref:rubrerythrin family protein n=1 Tax=Flavobacterium sp. UBA6031 TaxID=1946551 RepID=UPI0025BA0559|nr:ferritin family protein [Flavobacterium sp. UBA6031]